MLVEQYLNFLEDLDVAGARFDRGQQGVQLDDEGAMLKQQQIS
jgi:hypothetical protein